MKILALKSLLLGSILAFGTATAAAADDPRPILADMLMNDAIGLASNVNALPAELELGLRIAIEAATLVEKDPDLWRAVVQLADLADAPAITDRALAEVTRLDPTDDVAALRRLLNALNRMPTVEQRRQAVSALLAEGRLPAALGSRVAFDLAIVLQRAGDLEGYLEWLAEAVALDPTNPLAASDLAGYLAGTTADPTLQAELLMARCLANPTFMPAIEGFAEFLTREGADQTAKRLRLLILSLRGSAASARIADLLFASTATWAAGDHARALELLQRRQDRENDDLRRALSLVRQSIQARRPVDELIDSLLPSLTAVNGGTFRRIVEEWAPDPPPTERVADAVAPLPVALASAVAAISHPAVTSGDAPADQFERSAATLRRAILAELREQERAGAAVDSLMVPMWLALWLLHDAPEGPAWVAEIVDPLAELHAGKLPPWIEGWIALRRDGAESALRIFEPLVDSEPIAALGAALALIELDRRRDGATLLLDVARSLPATVSGVWARERLTRLLGTRVPLTSTAEAVDAVASTLPETFDRMLLHPGRHVSISTSTFKQDFAPFERVEIDLEVHNRSNLPLSISATGPIRSTVAISLEMTTFGSQSSSRDMPMPIFVDIGRRLRIEPWETLRVRANLSRGVVGPQTTLGLALLDLSPLGSHAVLRGRAVLNPTPAVYGGRRGLVEPGALGAASAPLALRSMGVEMNAMWFDRTVALLSDSATPPDPIRAVALATWLARVDVDSVLMSAASDVAQRIDQDYRDRIRAIELVLPRFDPLWQATIAKMLTSGRPRLAELERTLRSSPHRWVKLSSLLSTVKSADDPLLDEIRRGDDESLRRMADLVEKVLALRAAEHAESRGR